MRKTVCSLAFFSMVTFLATTSTWSGPTPVLMSLNPTAMLPGGMFTVNGQNFSDITTWTAVVELQSGEKFEQPITGSTATTFKIAAPMIYQGYNVTAKNADHRQRINKVKVFYVKKGTAVSNKLGFNILSFYPIIDSVFPTTANSTQALFVNGGNWNKNMILAPNMYWAVFELPGGRSVKTNLSQPIAPPPPLPVPFATDYTLIGKFNVKVPEVFCGKSKAEQDAINSGTSKFFIYGPTPFAPSLGSNKVDVQIRKAPLNVPNPYSMILAPTYASNAPTRSTVYYTGASQMIAQNCQKAIITGVKNASKYSMKLSNQTSPGVTLGPGQSTTAFNNTNANANWNAMLLSVEQNPSVKVEISWKLE